MFRLTDLFSYKRSYLALNNQQRFETYAFVNTRNKLKNGVRKQG